MLFKCGKMGNLLFPCARRFVSCLLFRNEIYCFSHFMTTVDAHRKSISHLKFTRRKFSIVQLKCERVWATWEQSGLCLLAGYVGRRLSVLEGRELSYALHVCLMPIRIVPASQTRWRRRVEKKWKEKRLSCGLEHKRRHSRCRTAYCVALPMDLANACSQITNHHHHHRQRRG